MCTRIKSTRGAKNNSLGHYNTSNRNKNEEWFRVQIMRTSATRVPHPILISLFNFAGLQGETTIGMGYGTLVALLTILLCHCYSPLHFVEMSCSTCFWKEQPP